MKNSVIIIAEAGVNHNGNLEKAKELIHAAFESGADYVKFQSFKASKLVSKVAEKAAYQKENMNDDHNLTQFNMLKKLELSVDDHRILLNHCERLGIKFLSTAFDVEGLDYLVSIGIELIKIPSGEITNYPYLKRVGELGLNTVLSTGMSSFQEIQSAVDVLVSSGLALTKLTILHCNTEYPTPMHDVNLLAMNTISNKLGVPIGYSDHTLGIEVPVAAVALGARVIEKHFTLDRTLPGPDHVASLEPTELKEMVKSIRNIELAISGDGLKVPSQSEIKNIPIARKSIHLKKNIKKGQLLKDQDLIALRPGDGISPMKWRNVIGTTATRDMCAGDKLQESDIE